MDSVGTAVEREVNVALKYPLKFHGVNKIVIRLGPTRQESPDYIELDGVGRKQYPSFNTDDYKAMSEQERREYLTSIIQSIFLWFDENFEDAEFVSTGCNNLGWTLPKRD